MATGRIKLPTDLRSILWIEFSFEPCRLKNKIKKKKTASTRTDQWLVKMNGKRMVDRVEVKCANFRVISVGNSRRLYESSVNTRTRTMATRMMAIRIT